MGPYRETTDTVIQRLCVFGGLDGGAIYMFSLSQIEERPQVFNGLGQNNLDKQEYIAARDKTKATLTLNEKQKVGEKQQIQQTCEFIRSTSQSLFG